MVGVRHGMLELAFSLLDFGNFTLEHMNQRSEETFCLNLQGRRWKQ
jgi:hypothetical protein